MPVVASVALAQRMERLGADATIAEGTESGGHVGELTTMALVPQVVDGVSIPVVAAGGIASGRQMLAAYALGACGVQVGNRLLVSEECPVHQNYKQGSAGRFGQRYHRHRAHWRYTGTGAQEPDGTEDVRQGAAGAKQGGAGGLYPGLSAQGGV